MIDAHVHAFPSLGQSAAESVRRVLGSRAAELLQQHVSPRMKSSSDRVWGRVKPLLPAGPMLDIERVARLQARTRGAHPWVERMTSLALLPPVALGGTLAGLSTSMARHGISRSILIGSRGAASNEWLLGPEVAALGERVVRVATLPELPPTARPRAWLDAYEALARAGAQGFKIHTNWDGIDATHPAIPALFEVASAYDLFVILHTGCFHVPGYKHERAVDVGTFERFFTAFPLVKVCLAHMHRAEPERAFTIMKRFEQVYTDTSWQPATNITRAVASVGSERVLLGSDWPLLHLELQGDAVARAKHALRDDRALEDVLEQSALRFLSGARVAARVEAEQVPKP